MKDLKYDNIYIASDQPQHRVVKIITKWFPKATILDFDEIKTFQFGSTCKNILLSHGSFSAIIGYLAFFSNIYYSEYNKSKMWHGDMFSIDGWIECKYL